MEATQLTQMSITFACATNTVADCGRWGYCDTSIGRCICAPGWHGDACEHTHFGACRLHAQGEMACMTFRGLMSCQCRLECERKFGGVMRRHPPVCWDWAESDLGRAAAAMQEVNLSSFPQVSPEMLELTVTFRAPTWPPMGKCARDHPPHRSCPALARSLRRATNLLGGVPQPNSFCHRSCSHRGTCLLPVSELKGDHLRSARERFPLSGNPPTGTLHLPRCICHDGYSGAGCQLEDAAQCFNKCSGSGRCVGRFCLCDRGRQGVDCSLSFIPPPVVYDAPAIVPPPAAWEVSHHVAQTKYVPTYVYPLPTTWSLEAVYQRDMDRRGQYYANLMYLEQLLKRKDSVVEDPEQAAVFFVPVMVTTG